jgi:AcrR family transcriptional regulator
LSKAELRERVLATGSALLGEEGVTVSLYHLNMEELFRRVGVPRSSAFAAFGGKEELITDLMIRLLQPDPGDQVGFSPATAELAQSVIDRYADRLTRADGSRDPEGEYAVLREAVRVTLRQNVDDTEASSEWRTFMALSATVPSLPPGRRERVAAALLVVEENFVAAMTQFYGGALVFLGRRPRPGLEWRHVVSAGATIVEGMVSRRRMGSAIGDDTVLAPGIDGEPVEWTLTSLAYLALLEGLTEPAG